MMTKIIFSGTSGSGDIHSEGMYLWENDQQVLLPVEELPFITLVGNTVRAADILSLSTLKAICGATDKWTDIKANIYSVDVHGNEFYVVIQIL